MKGRTASSWAGVFSIIWLLGVYLFFAAGKLGRFLNPLPEWLIMLLIFAGWLGFGLLLAIAGLLRGNIAGKLGGVIGIIIIGYFTWPMVGPRLYHPRPPTGRNRLNYGDSLIYGGAPFCCVYVGLQTNEATAFDQAFWRFAKAHDIRKPSRGYRMYSGPPRATCHNDHVSAFVYSTPTDYIVSRHGVYAQFEDITISWEAGFWSHAYWPSNASRVLVNQQEVLAPLSGFVGLAPNDTNYSLQDFKQLCSDLTNSIQKAFPDRVVTSFSYDGGKP